MTTSAQAVAGRHPAVRKTPVFLDRWFYFCMSLLVAAIVMYGFGHTVRGNLLEATPPRPWILWVHAVLFSGWVGIFIAQSALVRTRNVKIHRRLGWFGAGWAGAMTVIGPATAIVMARFELAHPTHARNPVAFMIVPFWDIACFATLFWMAVWWRRKPELHRRLVLMATCCLLVAAFARFPQAAARGFMYDWVDVLILLGVARDLVVTRRIHKTYACALPVLFVGQRIVLYTLHAQSAWWMCIAHALVRA